MCSRLTLTTFWSKGTAKNWRNSSAEESLASSPVNSFMASGSWCDGGGGLPATVESGLRAGVVTGPAGAVRRAGFALELGDLPFHLGDPVEQATDRLADRIGDLVVVEVDAVGDAPALLGQHHAAGDADHRHAGPHRVDDHRVGRHPGVVAHRDGAEDLGAR